MKIDLKTIVLIGTLLFSFAGFYYTTEARLSKIETQILFLERQVQNLKKANKHIYKLIKNKKRISSNND